jgi:hypothetical protein
MVHFLQTLNDRNKALYYYGWSCFIAVLVCVLLFFITDTQVLGINAWIKPLKFFLSAGIFSWSMAWYMGYLDAPRKVAIYSWMVIIVLGFETIYIAIQAGLGELSHFNDTDQFHLLIFGLMGLAITVMTLWTGYIGWLFFRQKFPELPLAYVWGIRIGILLFVIFALQGGVMGQNMAHTVGAPDGGAGLPLVNWSTAYGDLRIAHFLGMHALQLIPILSYYLIKNAKVTIAFGLAYFLLTTLILFQALNGIPLIRL